MPKQTAKKCVLFLRVSKVALALLLLLGIGVITTLFMPANTRAASSSTVNFQARLLTAAGSLVPDGDYNVEFKLFNISSSSGSSQGSCIGDTNCLWTETRTGANKVRVVNGYLTVNLGSVTAFPSINWDQEMWLSMNIGGTGTATWDGEMTPRLKLTAVPYAFRAGQLATLQGGNTSTLGFATQTSARSILLPDESGTLCIQSSTACGFALTSGSGNYIQNQNSSDQTANFRISGTGRANTSLLTPNLDAVSSGTLSIGMVTATGITLGQASTSTVNAGKFFSAGDLYVGTISVPGSVVNGRITSISSGSTNVAGVFRGASGQSVDLLQAQDSAGACQWRVSQSGTSGSCDTSSGASDSTAFRSGDTSAASSSSGTVTIRTGHSTSSGNTGTLNLNTGNATSGNSGHISIDVGTASGTAGTIGIGNTNAGQINIGHTSGANSPVALLGQVTSRSTTNATNAFQVQNSSSRGIFSVDTTNTQTIFGNITSTLGNEIAGKIVLADGTNDNFGLTLNTTTLTANRTITLPNETGTVCLQGSSGCGFLTNSSGVQLQGSSPGTAQTGNFNITGTGIAGTLQAGTIDTPSGTTTLNIGTTNATGGINLNQNTLVIASDSTQTAFRVQNASSVPMFTVDNLSYRVVIGKSATGSQSVGLTFTNSSNSNKVTLLADTNTSASYQLQLPIALGVNGDCLKQTSTSGSTASLIFGSCASGSFIQDTTTAQSANLYVQAASSGSVAGVFRANAGGSGDILDLRNGSGTIVGSFGSTGSVLVKPSTNSTTAFRIQNSLGINDVFNADTSNARVGINMNNPSYTLDVNGDANVGLFSNYRVGGTIVCNSGGCTPSSGSSNYIQNQNSGDQTANFRISGTGRANTSLQTPLLDTASAGALNIGTTNATSIELKKSTTVTGGLTQSGGAVSLTGNATSAISTSSGTLTLQSTSSSDNIIINSGSTTLNSTGTITVGSANTGTVNVGALTNNARTVNVGIGTGGSQTQTVNVGSTGGSSVTTIQGGTGASALNLTTGTNGSINLTAAGTGNINFATNSASSKFTFQSNTNSTTAFQIKPSSGTSVLNVDTSNSRIGIGTESPSRTLNVAINNTQTTAPMALLEQAGTGDVSVELKSAAKSFIVGLDSSDSSTFKISSSTASANSSTFGYTTAGGSTDSGDSDSLSCSKFTSGASAGTLTSMSVHVDSNIDSSPNNKFQLAIYSDNGGSPSSPGTRLANSADGTLTANSWNTVSLSAPISASTTYWLCYYSNGTTSAKNNMHYDTGVANQAVWAAWGGSWPSTFSADGHWDAKFSMYATYSISGAYDSFSGSLFNLTDTGQAIFKNSTNSGTAFQIQDSSSTALLTADTSNSTIQIGSATTDSTATLFVLDSYNQSSDPSGTNGALYYNSNKSRLRCYENSAWKNCRPVTSLNFLGTSGIGSVSTWNNMPAALTEFFANTAGYNVSNRVLYDMTDVEQARFIVNLEWQGSGMPVNAELRVQYSTDQSTWNYLDGSSGPAVNISAFGLLTSSWVNIASGARGDVYLRVVAINGNGTVDPIFGLVQLQMR